MSRGADMEYGRGDLAHRMVRGRTRHSWHVFWLPTAQPANVGSLLKYLYQAKRAELGFLRRPFRH